MHTVKLQLVYYIRVSAPVVYAAYYKDTVAHNIFLIGSSFF
jgi:hypothetical protein